MFGTGKMCCGCGETDGFSNYFIVDMFLMENFIFEFFYSRDFSSDFTFIDFVVTGFALMKNLSR